MKRSLFVMALLMIAWSGVACSEPAAVPANSTGTQSVAADSPADTKGTKGMNNAKNVQGAEQHNAASVDELKAYISGSGRPVNGSQKIKNIRRLWHEDKSENFYLEGCLTAVMKAIGEKPEYDYPFFLAIGGGLFAQPYCHRSEHADASAGSSAAFDPARVKEMVRICGYDCLYIDQKTIVENYDLVIDVIKTAVNKGVPVITKGIGNAQCGDKFYDPLPEWSNIGGYGEGDVLFVNVYPERIPTDEHGYIAIKGGLKKSRGLFIVTTKVSDPDIRDVLTKALHSIPAFISRPDMDGYSFGQKAYYDWADGLLMADDFTDETIRNGIAWKKQDGPFVADQTRGYYFRAHYDRMFAGVEDRALVEKIKDIYTRMGQSSPQPKEFFVTREEIADPAMRKSLAEQWRAIGNLHNELFELFK